jgi:hypothetical protein
MKRGYPRPIPLGNSIQQLITRQGLGEGLESLAELNRLWHRIAGPEWRQCSWVHGWRDGVLVVGVSSPGTATRLRFEAPELRARLQRAGLTQLQEITARVQPEDGLHRPRRHRRYSPSAAQRVAREAEEVTDPELRAALTRLATHLEHPPEDGE